MAEQNGMSRGNSLYPVISDEYFIEVGKVAAQWAVFQAIIDEAIHVLARVDEKTGLCLTAQISSMPGKRSTLISLLSRRGCPDPLIAKMNKLLDRASAPAGERNDIVHGVLRVNVREQRVVRQNIKAKSVFSVSLADTDPSQPRALVTNISDLTKEFLDLFREIRSQLFS